MRYEVNAVQQVLEMGQPKTDQHGNLSFKVWVHDAEKGMVEFFKNVKPGHEPKKGDFLEGSLAQAVSKAGNQYWKFTPEQKPFGGGFGSPAPSRMDNPEVQDQIMRQNALTNAVAYCSAKNPKDMTVDAVLDTASRFARFSKTGSVHSETVDRIAHTDAPVPDFSDEVDMS